MKSLVLLMSVFMVSMRSASSFALAPATPAVVERFYAIMDKMWKAGSDVDAFDYREHLKDCFRGKRDSGIPVPNDFYSWRYTADTETTANQYANMYYELAYRKKAIRMEKYAIGSSQYVSEVDLRQYRSQSNGLIQTVVDKTFTDGRITRTFSDTLIVERGEIVVFKNSMSTDDGEDIDALRVLAASYYTLKQYYSAYRIYEKIIRIDPENANAYYRLGLMTFWRQGCRLPRKEARRKGLEYAERAYRLGFYKAETAIYYMEHPQAI